MISIILGTYNDGKYLGKAIQTILDQSYKNFELILIDDGSTDNTQEVIAGFKDKRIKLYHNPKSTSAAKFRNQGIKLSKGKYIFFADSDAYMNEDWLKEGLKTFTKEKCIGVEGLTYYVEKGFKQSISDKPPGTVETPGHYLGCNLAITREIWDKLGGFNEKFVYHSDREFIFKALKYGVIPFNPKMHVIHVRKLWSVKSLINSAKRASSRVYMFKEGLDKSFITFRIMFPKNLIKILIPPLVLLQLFKHKNNTWLDFKLACVSYIKFVYQRYYIWRTAWKEGVFLL
jgi:glycosyltransferase involved in cell wall biosynthesis